MSENTPESGSDCHSRGMYRHLFPGNRPLSFPERLVYARIGALAAFRARKKHSSAPNGRPGNFCNGVQYIGKGKIGVFGRLPVWAGSRGEGE
jgi:hypothetical protein